MATLRPRVQWRWMAVASVLAGLWMFVWDSAAPTGLLYVNEVLVSVVLAFGVFWLYRRVADVVFLKRADPGAAVGRVVGTSVLVVLASYLFVATAYAVKINDSPGPQELQALWGGVFVISTFGIYRVLDIGDRPEKASDSV